MTTPLQTPRGTHDIFGIEARQHAHINALLAQICGRYGAEPISTPIFENLAVFARTLGEGSDVVAKEMYTFADRGGEMLALRPEGTAGVARAFINAGLYDTLPRAFYYAGPMFRYERPQKGRQRQFHQAGVEFLGTTGALADAEAIACAWRFLQELKITAPLTLEINTLGTVAERHAFRDALAQYFRGYEQTLSADSLRRLAINPLRILDSKDSGDRALFVDAPAFADYLSPESRQWFDDVRYYLEALGIPSVHSPRLVRGLDYYTHTAFEVTTTALGAQATVLAGGRYDGLLASMGGKDAPGIGWAAGVERLALLMPSSDSVKVLALCALGTVPSAAVLHLAEEIRAVCPVEILRGNTIGKLLNKADRRGATAALFYGEAEEQAGIFPLKNLRSSTQVNVPRERLCEAISEMFQ
jgi:histidyl-tRNA synthetase